MKFANLGALANHFERVAERLPVIEKIMLEEIGEAVEKKAKGKLGSYQAGWAPLSDATIDDKARYGYPIPSPLLRTGHMQGGIGHRVEANIVRVGASPAPDKPVALFHELGTSKMPARPFIGPAMAESKPEILVIIRTNVAMAFRGR